MVKLKGEEFRCLLCGKTFSRNYSDVRRGRTKYCSLKCSHLHRTLIANTRSHKVCPICKQDKAMKEYSKRTAGYCRTCSVKHSKKWKQDNRIRWNAKQREIHVRNKYGISMDEYRSMMSIGKCAICNRADIRLNLDHNHKTNIIREVLCINCNKGLGHFQDNPELLIAAARYLDKHELVIT